jgi:hypothetical protein
MQRDRALFAAGVAVLVISASLAVPPLLVYGDRRACDPDPTDDDDAPGDDPATR